MTNILVTGGTRGLGIPTTEQLRAAGHDVRVLSRRSGDVRGDLDTGEGLDAALAGIHTVVHLATNRRKDIGQTRNLLAAARRAGVQHLIFMSIVGVDRIDYFYYRDKVASEHAIAASGIPYTILRATQFHSFVGALFAVRLPVLLAPDLPVQTIATEDVARRLTELVEAGPSGRVPDIGGPEIRAVPDLAREWNEAHGTRKPIWRLRLPGKTVRGFKAGLHMTGLPGYGTGTFAEYAAEQAAAKSKAVAR